MGIGSQLYADDDPKGALSGVANYSDDDLNWLYPTYVANLKSFICSSTRNEVTNDYQSLFPNDPGPKAPNLTGVALYQDRMHGNTRYVKSLVDNAPGKDASPYSTPTAYWATSYEVAGFFGGSGSTTVSDTSNVRKTQASVSSHTYSTVQSGTRYNFIGQRASPSFVWIIYDEDDAGGVDRPNEDFPDKGDNHGMEGGNVVFCDGHAEWISRKRYVGSFIQGTDEAHPLAATQ
jgi:prepilin-type processing-associated H-X9-DG protein